MQDPYRVAEFAKEGDGADWFDLGLVLVAAGGREGYDYHERSVCIPRVCRERQRVVPLLGKGYLPLIPTPAELLEGMKRVVAPVLADEMTVR